VAQALILPWTTLALLQAATYARLTRTSVLETLNEDHIRTARAYGLTERRIVVHHALRGALTPLVTQLAVDVGLVLGGRRSSPRASSACRARQAAGRGGLHGGPSVVSALTLLAGTFVVVANAAAICCTRPSIRERAYGDRPGRQQTRR